MRKQRGYLLIIAAVAIVIVGFVATSLSYIVSGDTRSTANQLDAERAHYLAESGLEKAVYEMAQGYINACDNTLDGNPLVTNQSLGKGTFTVTAVKYKPASITLAGDIDDLATTIPISSVTDVAPFGRAILTNEAINYGKLGTSEAECGTGFSACFLNVRRAIGGTGAVVHYAGESVVQNQCTLLSKGYVPNATNPIAERQVTDAVLYGQGGGNWITGDKTTGLTAGETMLSRNSDGEWERKGPFAEISNVNLVGLAMISSSQAWAVGAKTATQFTVIGWQGATTRWKWADSLVTPAPGQSPQNLSGIDCYNSTNCWAVGDANAILRYSGSPASWAQYLHGLSLGNLNLYAVTYPSLSLAFAVGTVNSAPKRFTIIKWDGASWSDVSSNYAKAGDLRGVDCVSTSECWAVGSTVGDSGRAAFVHYAGGSWDPVSTDIFADFNGIKCTSSGCIAVGNSGVAATVAANSTTWALTSLTGVGNNNLYAVACLTFDNCIAAGASSSIIAWNGSSWSPETKNATVASNLDLRSVGMLTAGAGVVPIEMMQD